MLNLYNTLTRKIELFQPLQAGQVGLYSCGPTVYNLAHVGNLRTYVFVDLLKRYLLYSGYQVNHIMNITDVDDKTIRDSQAEGKDLKEFTEKYTQIFFKDLGELNILKATETPKATEHIEEMVQLVKTLMDKGFAYKADDGSIYFKISSFENYGKLANLNNQTLKQNAEGRLNQADEYSKENANDFVLWKAWREEDGNVFWETELGKGRPGWHIECSAMSMKYLGATLDIHTGGVDLIFPHHSNEIAQSEAATGKRFVNYWLHNEHVIVEGKKMSKSEGNTYTLTDIKEKGYHPLLLKLILMRTHYRKVVDLSFDDFKEVEAIASSFLEFLINLDSVQKEEKSDFNMEEAVLKTEGKFNQALNDDLNISLALSALHDFVNQVNKEINQVNAFQAKAAKNFVFKLDQVLGFLEPLYKDYQDRLKRAHQDPDIQNLIEKRQQARQEKKYELADQLRDELSQYGVSVKDTPSGYSLQLNKLI